jgi:hypothetical protein
MLHLSVPVPIVEMAHLQGIHPLRAGTAAVKQIECSPVTTMSASISYRYSWLSVMVAKIISDGIET